MTVGKGPEKKGTSRKAPRARKRPTAKKPVRRKRAVARRQPSGKGTVAKKVGKRPEKEGTLRTAPRRVSNVADLERLVRGLRSEKSRLHRRLSELVQEIGYLRPYELRNRMLERQLAERDSEIADLKARLGETGPGTATG